MAPSRISGIILHLRRAALLQDGGGLTDGQLLEQFISRRDEAALAALVRRHAPMVWGVCRRILRNHHDAEDAFQATFLVLVRKAAYVLPRSMVANWLYGVARQTALKARATVTRREGRERQVVSTTRRARRDGSGSASEGKGDVGEAASPARFWRCLVHCWRKMLPRPLCQLGAVFCNEGRKLFCREPIGGYRTNLGQGSCSYRWSVDKHDVLGVGVDE